MLPLYNVLRDDEVQMIHEAALAVLEKAGLALDHPKAIGALADLGAKVSDDKKRVFLQPDLVEKLLARAPRKFLCAARDPKFDLQMEQGRLYARQGGGPIAHFDMRTGALKPLTMEEAARAVKLVAALPNINAAATSSPQDINPETYDIATLKMFLEHCPKHIWALITHSSRLPYELEMAAAVAGGKEQLRARPIISGIFCVIAPLRFPYDEVERLIQYADYGIPVKTPVTALIGGSSPYTLAGTMTQMTAEFLGSVAIVQALAPGLPQWHYTLLQYLDMKSGRSITFGPETLLLYAAGLQMGRRYGLPTISNTLLGGDIQSHQLMYHYGINPLVALQCGATLQAGAGAVESGNYYSPEALVIMDESLEYLKHFVHGFEINDETLAVNDIVAAAEKGEYVSSKLTMKYLRREKRHVPSVMDFSLLSAWRENPKTMIDRAAEKAAAILATVTPEPSLPPEVSAELRKILSSAERHFG